MKTGKIIVADPSLVVQNGLSALVRELLDFEVVLKSSDLHTVFTRVSLSNPDILIINPLMIDYSKRMMVRSFLPEGCDTRLVAFVTGYVDDLQLKQYDAVIGLNDDLQRLRSTLNQVMNANKSEGKDADSAALSEREKEVLVGLAKGQKNNDIADNLNISVHTVITHRKNIVKKTGIKSVAALTVYAILNNLIDEKDII